MSQTEVIESNTRNYAQTNDPVLIQRKSIHNYYLEVKVSDNIKNSLLNYHSCINLLNNDTLVIKASPCYKTLSGKRLGLTNVFYVKIYSNTIAILNSYVQNNNLEILGNDLYMNDWYIISCSRNNVKNSLEFANQFYESGLFVASEPEFIYHDLQTTNDTFYNNQWGLHNTGQYGNQFAGIDINIEQAWNITKGNNSKVAIYDHGFEMNHPDLLSNVFGDGFDAKTGMSPAQVRGNHGTACAGIVGAVQNNGIGISGVAPETKILSISISLQFSDTPLELASGFNWAQQNNVDVISNSWGGYTPSDIITDAIYNAINNGRNGKGCIVVFAFGNENNTNIRYPGCAVPEVIVVGAISPCGERKSPSSCDGEGWGACYGSQLDIVAPGVKIPTTDRQGVNGYFSSDYFLTFNGTSSACPHVAGVAALILSVNPSLSAQQVSDIIEQTAQKISPDLYDYQSTQGRPNGSWNNEMGYGLVDAYAAVQLAQNMYSTTLDLYIKDKPDDIGIEPNPNPQLMWTSKDIWIRNNDDDGLTHQNPEYRSNGSPNYIYVRIINKSSVPSHGNELLNLNWAKASTALVWPQNWDGSLQNSAGYNLGGVFPTSTLPVLQPGEETIIKIPWVVPNPDNYSDNNEPWHFCLLARIDGVDDPLQPISSSVNAMAINDNNVAWTNITIVDLETEITGARVLVANPSQVQRTFFLKLYKQVNECGKAVFEEAEVSLKMDDVLYSAWDRGGKIAKKLNPTQEENRKLVKGDNVILDNITFNSKEMGLLTLDFNFLIKELTDKDEYTYHVVQKDANTGEVIGGETFIIRKKSRQIFVADAGGDKEVDLNETITISAEDINEPAVYNWYNSKSDLIYQGKDLTVTADVTEQYKLEVIATTDGFKDYASIEVKFKPNIIERISPNPALNNLVINYKINEASSAYLMVLGHYGSGTSYNYILDVNLQEIQINTSNYQNGFYTVALVCDGEIVDAKTLLKQ